MNPSALPAGARRVPKPWGYEIIWAESPRYVGKILHIEAGHETSLQYHRVKDETIYLLRGALRFDSVAADGSCQQRRVGPGESIHIPPGLRHRMAAIETCDVVEVSTPELDDVVRIEDKYGRVGR